MLENGTTLAGYRIAGVVGQGGMGVVYEAIQLSLNRTVALKVLAPHLSDDLGFRERFRREGKIQAGIDHAHIVSVYEAGEADLGLFIAMRLIRGPSLKEIVTEGNLNPTRAVRLLTPIADALDTAHGAGLIHRDVKPQNILVGTGDHPYLADFGLTRGPADASLTKSGQFVGTFNYMSPEQIEGKRSTKESDLYALAAVLYESLTGDVPYRRDSEAALLYAHLSEPPPRVTARRSDLPERLDDVIEKGMAKQPERRYESAAELLGAAEEALTARVRFRAPAWAQRRARRLFRSTIVRVGAALLLVVGIAGFLAGRSGSEGGPPAATSFASAGGLELSFPDTWRRLERPPELRGIRFSEPIALAPSNRSSEAALVAGRVDAAGSSLLPAGFRRLLRRAPSRGEPVRLGDLEAYRYTGLTPKGERRSVTLYAVPTTRGVATVACLADPARAGGFRLPCERVATSLKLTEGESFPIGPDSRYAERVAGAVGSLNAARASGRRTLRHAGSRTGQAAASEDLARAYGLAAAGLLRTRVSPAVRPTHDAIVNSLRRTANGYTRMASAARRGSGGGYDAASNDVRRRERGLRLALARLERLGYRLR